ncbi:MAG: ABC transporter substrate-binding protein [Proteobacteria bacterium]|nr:ABC transporter substrate-binding protein [Pseudomonadota bacterium]
MKKILMTGIAALALAATTATAQEVPKSPEVAETGKMVIANTLEYAPFEFIDENGQQVGANIELAAAVAKLMGAKLEVTRIPFPSMIPGLAADRFRIAWETFSATEERLKQVDFVMFLKSGLVVSTTPDKKASFTGDMPLCGKRIGVIGGTVSDFLVDKLVAECAAKGQPALDKKVFLEGKDVIQAALSDRIDGKMDDATASGYFEVTSKGQLVVLPGLYDEAPLGIAVKKGDTATATMLADGLNALIADGTYKTVMEKYGLGTAMIDKAFIVDSMDDIK